MGVFLSEQERELKDLAERVTMPEVNVPKIAKTYLHNGEKYECYDVHADATYGNKMLTVKATYRRIEDNGETD